MTRRLWLALIGAHLLGLAAIFGGDALLHGAGASAMLASRPPDNPFALASEDGAAGRSGSVTILLYLGQHGGGRDAALAIIRQRHHAARAA